MFGISQRTLPVSASRPVITCRSLPGNVNHDPRCPDVHRLRVCCGNRFAKAVIPLTDQRR